MYFTIASKKNKDTLIHWFCLFSVKTVSPAVGREARYYYSSRQINPTNSVPFNIPSGLLNDAVH